MAHAHLLLALASIFGFFMAWGIGANDVANAMGTSVGSGALSIKQAILIAAIFECAGTILAGGQVTATIRSGIINPMYLVKTPELLIYGMLASLLAAGTWLAIATKYGWPVSTTHSIVGAIIGFAVICIGVHSVHWDKVTSIVLSWVITPIIAGVISFALFKSVQKLIFNTDDPIDNAKRYVPYYIFLVAFVIAMVTFIKGLKHLGLDLSFFSSTVFSIVFSIIVSLIGIFFIRRLKLEKGSTQLNIMHNVESIFGILMVFTACAMAFAHGSNDVANAIGPLAAIVGIISHGGQIGKSSGLPFWILLLGAVGIVSGLSMYGYRVMATVGTKITKLTPSSGFAATLSAAGTIVIASGTGLPISTTQTLVGAVLGVGLARGIAALDLGVIRNIFMSWIITLPAGAILSIIFFYIFRAIF